MTPQFRKQSSPQNGATITCWFTKSLICRTWLMWLDSGVLSFKVIFLSKSWSGRYMKRKRIAHCLFETPIRNFNIYFKVGERLLLPPKTILPPINPMAIISKKLTCRNTRKQMYQCILCFALKQASLRKVKACCVLILFHPAGKRASELRASTSISRPNAFHCGTPHQPAGNPEPIA